MSPFRSFGVAVSLFAAFCAPQRPRDVRIASASTLTDRCVASRLSKWNLHASAAGADCDVLLVETPVVLDDSLVEAIHYGSGVYAVIDGGVRRFGREHAFRAVAYRDVTGRIWTYGPLTQGETESLQPCR